MTDVISVFIENDDVIEVTVESEPAIMVEVAEGPTGPAGPPGTSGFVVIPNGGSVPAGTPAGTVIIERGI